MRRHRRPGFTLAECVVGMLVIAIVVLACYQATIVAMTVSQQRIDQPVAWYQLLNKLESDHWQFTLGGVSGSHRRLQLNSQTRNKQYELLVSDRPAKMIYLRKIGNGRPGGFLPLYGPVAVNGFYVKQLDSRRVYMEVTDTDGQTRHATLCFRPATADESPVW